jgi:hypothetical protein
VANGTSIFIVLPPIIDDEENSYDIQITFNPGDSFISLDTGSLEILINDPQISDVGTY